MGISFGDTVYGPRNPNNSINVTECDEPGGQMTAIDVTTTRPSRLFVTGLGTYSPANSGLGLVFLRVVVENSAGVVIGRTAPSGFIDLTASSQITVSGIVHSTANADTPLVLEPGKYTVKLLAYARSWTPTCPTAGSYPTLGSLALTYLLVGTEP